MGWGKGKTEKGQGGKLGHSNRDGWGFHDEEKESSRKQRRLYQKELIENELSEIHHDHTDQKNKERQIMGIVNCHKHGNSGFLEVCGHIDRDLKNGIYPTMNDMPVASAKLCDKCYKALELDAFGLVTMDDLLNLPDDEAKTITTKLEEKYALIPNRSIHCIHCVEEIKKQIT